MSRKEEILNKAIEVVDKNYMNVGIKTTHEASVAACREIAEWAEKTMIEKACELLARMIWEVTYEDLEGNSVEHHDKMEFIDDFKNYMKGK